MGSLLSCDQCHTREENSVMTFSDALVFRAIGVSSSHNQEHQQIDIDQNIPQATTEEEWFLKIRAIDDQHSAAYGLTVDGFDALAKTIEARLAAFVATNICRNTEVIDCYKQNPTCASKCQQEVESFVDCVDIFRLKAVGKGLRSGSEVQKIN